MGISKLAKSRDRFLQSVMEVTGFSLVPQVEPSSYRTGLNLYVNKILCVFEVVVSKTKISESG